MGALDLAASRLVRLGSAKLTVSTAATANFDFGTPDDIKLGGTTGPGSTYRAGDRILIIFDSSTTGTTNAISFGVLDAADSSGSIGSTAAATTDGTLTGGTGDQYTQTFVLLKPGRPWIRCTATGVGTTDTHVVQCTVYAIPRSGL